MMLSIYPSTPIALATISGIITLIKWVFAGVTVVLLLIGLIVAIKNGFRSQT